MTTIDKRPIVAAVAFDDRQDAVVKTALSVAKAFGLSVELLHVLEPVDFTSTPIEATAGGSVFRATRAVERIQAILRGARQALDDLRVSCAASGVDVSKRVIVGSARDVIETEAIARKAVLIVIGYPVAESLSRTPNRSMARGLLQNASVPVLAVPAGVPFDAARPGLQILLADDRQQNHSPPSTLPTTSRAAWSKRSSTI